MAVTAERAVGELDGAFVLAPERYDPRRSAAGGGGTVPLRALVASVRDTVGAGNGGTGACVVLDTSDAREGVVVNRKPPAPVGNIGSAKKVVETGDVIVSRLRPYLRQAAFVDAAVPFRGGGVRLLCSTEFFVLRSVDGGPVAFLVPFLLSRPVQDVLAAAQEGGHHPRVNEATVLGLPVPESLVARRRELSDEVARGIELFRRSEHTFAGLVADAEECFRGVADVLARAG